MTLSSSQKNELSQHGILSCFRAGHRLVVSKFRFLETTGIGGLVCAWKRVLDCCCCFLPILCVAHPWTVLFHYFSFCLQSNPCVEPIYDEIIEAPSRFKVKRNGRVNEIANLHVLPQDNTGSNRTIGAIRNRVSPGLLEGLFENGTSQESLEEAIEELKHQIPTDESPDEEVDPAEITITAPVLI